MFKTSDLSQILLTLNGLKTEFTAVCEDRKQVRWLSQLGSIPRLIVDEAQGAEDCFKPAELRIKTRSASAIFLMSSAKLHRITCDFRNLKISTTDLKTIEQNEGFCHV